ncbi:MAG: phosphoglycerate kinase [bacterium]
MKTIRAINVRHKKVLVRCDFNVSIDENGNVREDFRITKTLPTISYLLENEAKIILMSHLGDPQGVIVDNLKLDRVVACLNDRLASFIGRQIKIIKADDCIGENVEKLVNGLNSGEILVLENLRFRKEEEENNDLFARKLASLADIYINDAFGVCHRAHASVVGVPKYLSKAAGLLLEKEIKVLEEMMENPQRPLVAVIGGKKVETKLKPINKISAVADLVLINNPLQTEIAEKDIKLAYPEKIVMPIDSLENNFDIGPQTAKLFREKILTARTVFWNGPMGKIEDKKFANGTVIVAETIIESKAFSIAGGGETVEAIVKMGLLEKFNHVSTGGGAMLMFLAGESLPGIDALA